MTKLTKPSHLPGDPVAWVRELESIWQAKDAERAVESYAEDAVMIYGADQRQAGEALHRRPGLWFEFASDLQIEKQYIAHTHDCIVTSWNSIYTNPETNRRMRERGIEFFRFENGKISEQHVWQHSWPDGEKPEDASISI